MPSSPHSSPPAPFTWLSLRISVTPAAHLLAQNLSLSANNPTPFLLSPYPWALAPPIPLPLALLPTHPLRKPMHW
jgi:hypothetical protein